MSKENNQTRDGEKTLVDILFPSDDIQEIFQSPVGTENEGSVKSMTPQTEPLPESKSKISTGKRKKRRRLTMPILHKKKSKTSTYNSSSHSSSKELGNEKSKTPNRSSSKEPGSEEKKSAEKSIKKKRRHSLIREKDYDEERSRIQETEDDEEGCQPTGWVGFSTSKGGDKDAHFDISNENHPEGDSKNSKKTKKKQTSTPKTTTTAKDKRKTKSSIPFEVENVFDDDQTFLSLLKIQAHSSKGFTRSLQDLICFVMEGSVIVQDQDRTMAGEGASFRLFADSVYNLENEGDTDAILIVTGNCRAQSEETGIHWRRPRGGDGSFLVCKLFDDGRKVMGKVKILPNGGRRGRKKSPDDLTIHVLEGEIIIKDLHEERIALPGATFQIPRGMDFDLINVNDVPAILVTLSERLESASERVESEVEREESEDED